MSSTATRTTPQTTAMPASRQAIALVFTCTVLGAAAQLFIKVGMNHFSMDHPIGALTNLPLIAGYVLYGINTLLLVLALREAELSLMYPIIALTYVWVTLLSYLLLHEQGNLYKNVGIATIVIGVAVIGRGGRK